MIVPACMYYDMVLDMLKDKPKFDVPTHLAAIKKEALENGTLYQDYHDGPDLVAEAFARGVMFGYAIALILNGTDPF